MSERVCISTRNRIGFGIAIVVLSGVGGLAFSASEKSTPAQPSANDITPPATLEAVRRVLELSPKEKLLLSAQRDSIDPLEQNGFYRLMKKIADLPALPPEQFRQLDMPSYANLLRSPGRYRLRPIRLQVRLFVVSKRIVGTGLRATPYWPDDGPIYELHATIDDQPDEPVLLYTSHRPAGLGSPDETLPDGRERYKTGPVYTIAGVYLQYYTGASTGDETRSGELRKYPVVLAWQVEPAETGSSLFAALSRKGQLLAWGGGVIGICIAVGLFIYLQRSLRKPSAAARGAEFRKYRPLREEQAPPPEPEPESESPAPVDPALTSAVEDYRREHPDSAERNNENGIRSD